MNPKQIIDELKEHGLSQYRIAKLSGLSEATICRLAKRPGETGARGKNPTYRVVVRLQAVLMDLESGKICLS